MPGTFELLGYSVEGRDDPAAPKPGALAYMVYGPRGAVYAMFRTHKNPNALWLMNGRTRACNGVALKGNYWFRDDGGTLRPNYC